MTEQLSLVAGTPLAIQLTFNGVFVTITGLMITQDYSPYYNTIFN